MNQQNHGLTQVIASDPHRLVNVYNPALNEVVTLHPKTDNFEGSRVLFRGYNGITGFHQDLCARFIGLDPDGNIVLSFSDTVRCNLEIMGAVHAIFERNRRSLIGSAGYEIGTVFDYEITITPAYFMTLVYTYGCIPIEEEAVEN